jgi:pimeloyl-ACP methyl ester carboxylesterase
MPFATNRGQRIHYTLDGVGPLVVLQHGYLSSTVDWKACGYVDVLSDAGFQVACVDSLAHGESDKPTDPALYALPQRAGDIVAVLDDLGADRAHLVGYSMGGWIAGGVAAHHPERLASVTIAGWDYVLGINSATAAMGDITVDAKMMLVGARTMAPEMVAWVTPEVEEAVLACGGAIANADHDASAAVDALTVPVLCWNGTEDPYHLTMSEWAPAHGHQYFSVPGDHLSAFYLHGRDAAARMVDFFRAAP